MIFYTILYLLYLKYIIVFKITYVYNVILYNIVYYYLIKKEIQS